MARRKRKPQVSQEVPFTPAKVRKTKIESNKDTAAAVSRAIKALMSSHVKKHKNGLLNLEHTPPYLVPIEQRNAKESPLLRLPPEVRHTIWRFALGGELIQLPFEEVKGYAVRYEQDRTLHPTPLSSIPCHRRYQKLPSAFHLPEVCRQVYSETALVAYSQSTFGLGADLACPDGSMKWIPLEPAHRRAVASVEPDPGALALSVNGTLVLSVMDAGLFARRRISLNKFEPFKQSIFPNLKTIVISKLAFKYVQEEVGLGRDLNFSEDDWKEWLTRTLKEAADRDIQVEFKDPDPSW